MVDSVASVSSVAFLDRDLDANQLGGSISWVSPADTNLVTGYNVYLAGGIGSNRSFVGSVPTEILQANLQSGQDKEDFNYVHVFTKSVLVEQTTPSAANISDTSAFASGNCGD